MTGERVFAERYRLLEPLGSGGMSVVWRAHDEVLDRAVAVKVISEAADPGVRPQLRTEARAAGAVCHPALAQVYDYGEAVGPDGATEPYLVMELVDGVALDTWLAEKRELPWWRAVSLCAALADALAEVHERGLVHRDIKPANVIVSRRGPKLVDFGICASVGEADAEDGQLVGTPAYVAPERIADAPVGPESDVYALGMLLYRMLAGALPWPVDTSTGLLRAHLFDPPPPVPELAELPAAVSAAVLRCLDKDPHGRPSAAEFAAILHSVPDGVGVPDEAELAASRDTVGLTAPDPVPAAAADPAPPVTARAPADLRTAWLHRTAAVLVPTKRRASSAALAATLLVALGLLGLLWQHQDRSIGSASASGPGVAAAATGCTAVFALRQDTGTGFAADVTVRSPGSRAAGAQVGFAFPGGQSVRTDAAVQAQVAAPGVAERAVPVQVHQTGNQVVATMGAALPAGATVRFPISGVYQQANPLPTAVTLGGSTCATQVSGVPGSPAASPVASPVAGGDQGGGKAKPGGPGPGPGPGPGGGKGGPGKDKGKH